MSNKKQVNFLSVILIFIIIAGFAVLFVFTLNRYFFTLKVIIVEGENNRYAEQEIIDASGLKIGDEVLFLSGKAISEKLKKELNYIKNVKVKKVYPDTVKIEIEGEKGFFTVKLGGDYYTFSESFKILEKTEQEQTGLIFLETKSISKCFVGELIEFSDIDIPYILGQFIEILAENGIAQKINSIDISDKFNIYMIYDNQFRIIIGNFEDIDIKVDLALNIIGQHLDVKGIIDVSYKKNEGMFSHNENIN